MVRIKRLCDVDTIQVKPNKTAYKYTNGIEGNEVWYHLLADFGHDFPLGEDENSNSSDLIWDFLSRYWRLQQLRNV